MAVYLKGAIKCKASLQWSENLRGVWAVKQWLQCLTEILAEIAEKILDQVQVEKNNQICIVNVCYTHQH
jgi:hypothetical protein